MLDGASVWGTEGAVVTADGCLVEDLTRVAGRSLEEHPIWGAGQMPRLEVDAVVGVVAARAAAHNFSHFVADTLPRVQLVRDSGVSVDYWLVSAHQHGWQREMLAAAGIGPERVISLNEHGQVWARRLVVPSRTGFAPYTAPWARRCLRAMLPVAAFGARTRRLLVCRSGARWRRLLNEEEIAAELAPCGFERIVLEELTFAEQQAAMGAAEVIVAVHGAGLAHLLGAPEGGVVVEIAHPDAVRPEFYGLASLAGWRHRMVLSSGLQDQGEPVALLDDLWADPALIRRALDSAGVGL
ncbi:glycosyltransferase family 61 protein [Streptomyces specialis]|uniref:glycosyltransferase family 61 protein n=1 Tax=Streptomyces specialis TaxID=498367 RepID=UPI00073E4AB4|nr:glycosyltransferase family 61 protein [Streptomyces specialis]